MTTTNFENLGRMFFKEMIEAEPVFNFRPDWLKNHETGQNLEIDIFYPTLNLAIEINGIFHGLESQKKKDILKETICRKRGIYFEKINCLGDFWRIKNKHFPHQEMSPKLVLAIKSYKPNTKIWGKIYAKQKGAEKYWGKVNKYAKLQNDETESIKSRLAFKNKTKPI